MSLSDFYRIRESAASIPSKSPPHLQTITSTDSNNSFVQRALAHKNKLLSYDRSKNIKQYNPLLTYENQKITDPYAIVDQNDDAIKDLNILCKYAKIATIRDRQLNERKQMEDMYKKKEERLDLMMELERLKEIKFKEEKEKEIKSLQIQKLKLKILKLLILKRKVIKF